VMQWKEPHLLLIATRRDGREKPRAISPWATASSRLESPAPARPYSDSDADPRAVNPNSGSISAVITGIPPVVARPVAAAVIAPVIASSTDQPASDTRSPAADRFNGAGLRDRGVNSGCSARRHSLSAADRQKGCCRDRHRSSRRQYQFSHSISPSQRCGPQSQAAWLVPTPKIVVCSLAEVMQRNRGQMRPHEPTSDLPAVRLENPKRPLIPITPVSSQPAPRQSPVSAP
jgi:hypothetical protein